MAKRVWNYFIIFLTKRILCSLPKLYELYDGNFTSPNWNESTQLTFRMKRIKFITNKISYVNCVTKRKNIFSLFRSGREGFEGPCACLWFVPKATDSFLSCLTSKRSRRITKLNRNWIIRRDEINALPWHFRSGRDTRGWLVSTILLGVRPARHWPARYLSCHW